HSQQFPLTSLESYTIRMDSLTRKGKVRNLLEFRPIVPKQRCEVRIRRVEHAADIEIEQSWTRSSRRASQANDAVRTDTGGKLDRVGFGGRVLVRCIDDAERVGVRGTEGQRINVGRDKLSDIESRDPFQAGDPAVGP